ncbi:MAG: class I SAM-dependent RNA methyltransferase [Planctomycetes bacterium]|nr:class I SAM-dependent RNA methyltransferase [Planctomycetota bacterium]
MRKSIGSTFGEPTPGEVPVAGRETVLRIERLVAGGAGLARMPDGRVAFVPLAAPGDRVRARVVRERRREVHAEILEVVEPGPARRAAPCPYFGTCGGCDWMHLAEEAQREAKGAILREALRRLGGVSWEAPIEVVASPPFGYRSRARLAVRGGRVGFLEARSARVVDVEACAVLEPEGSRALGEVRRAAREGNAPGEVHVAVGEEGAACSPPIPGVPAGPVTWRLGGQEFRFDPDAFAQANRALAEDLRCEAVGEGRGDRALDLYCGAGFFSLALAPRFREVLGVDGDARAIGRARENARSLPGLRFVAAGAREWFARGEAPERADFVLLDPPRTGTEPEVLEGVARLRPARAVLVGCDPATFARDVGRLVRLGWRLERLRAFDLFPQTHHVEAVGRLVPA